LLGEVDECPRPLGSRLLPEADVAEAFVEGDGLGLVRRGVEMQLLEAELDGSTFERAHELAAYALPASRGADPNTEDGTDVAGLSDPHGTWLKWNTSRTQIDPA